MDEKKVNRILNLHALMQIGVAGLMVVLSETGVTPSGVMAQNYAFQVVGCVLLLVCVPLALKMMSLERVQRRVKGNLRGYYTYALFRITLLSLPLFWGVMLYYLMMDVSMLYCALIAALSFIFVWPTESRMRHEMED